MAYKFGSLHTQRLDEAYHQHTALTYRILKEVMGIDIQDIPAVLERGRQIADADIAKQTDTNTQEEPE